MVAHCQESVFFQRQENIKDAEVAAQLAQGLALTHGKGLFQKSAVRRVQLPHIARVQQIAVGALHHHGVKAAHRLRTAGQLIAVQIKGSKVIIAVGFQLAHRQQLVPAEVQGGHAVEGAHLVITLQRQLGVLAVLHQHRRGVGPVEHGQIPVLGGIAAAPVVQCVAGLLRVAAVQIVAVDIKGFQDIQDAIAVDAEGVAAVNVVLFHRGQPVVLDGILEDLGRLLFIVLVVEAEEVIAPVAVRFDQMIGTAYLAADVKGNVLCLEGVVADGQFPGLELGHRGPCRGGFVLCCFRLCRSGRGTAAGSRCAGNAGCAGSTGAAAGGQAEGGGGKAHGLEEISALDLSHIRSSF